VGALVLAGYGLSLFFVMDVRRSTNSILFALFLALLGASLLGGLRTRARFGVRRTLPDKAMAGEPLAYDLVVTNLDSRPQADVAVIEDVEEPFPPFEDCFPEEAEARATSSLGRTLRELWAGGRRFGRLAQGPAARVEVKALARLDASGAARLRMRLYPLRRGKLRFRGAAFGLPDPLGLFRALALAEAPDTLLILPRHYPMNELHTPGGRRRQPQGLALAVDVGDSKEYVGLRDYQRGDPLRNIHWKSWARTGKPVVKEFQDEYVARCALVLDTVVQGLDFDAGVFEAAVSVAASVAQAPRPAGAEEGLLDLLFLADRVVTLTAGRGLGRNDAMLEAMATAAPVAGKTFGDLARPVLAHAPVISGCVLALLAWDEPRRALVHALRAHEVGALALVVARPGHAPSEAGVVVIDPDDIPAGLARAEAAAKAMAGGNP